MEYTWKVKCSRYRPGVAQRVGKDIALLFHDRGTRRGWVSSSTTRPHFTPGKDPVLILQETGWAPGPVWTGGKSRPHRDSIPDHQPVAQSLYRLSYPVHIIYLYEYILVDKTVPAMQKYIKTDSWQWKRPLDVHKGNSSILVADNSVLTEWRHEENNRAVANGQYILVRALIIIVYGEWSFAMVCIHVSVVLLSRKDWDVVHCGW